MSDWVLIVYAEYFNESQAFCFWGEWLRPAKMPVVDIFVVSDGHSLEYSLRSFTPIQLMKDNIQHINSSDIQDLQNYAHSMIGISRLL